MHGLEVLSFHYVGQNAHTGIELHSDIPHHVLYELRLIIHALGNVFFIGALEQSVELARSLPPCPT
jgi:hypothetical protein